MACEDCPTHNFGSNRWPDGADDPCNTSGVGIFCIGSYWLYDPTAPGADTVTYGTCPKLFIRTGGTCGVNEWENILLRDNVDYGCENGADSFGGIEIVVAGPIPAGLNQYGPVASITITNNTPCADIMSGRVTVGGLQFQYITAAGMVLPSNVRVLVEFSPDGGVTWLTNANNDITLTVVPPMIGQFALSGITFLTNTLGQGDSQTFQVRTFVEDVDGNFLGDAFLTTTDLTVMACRNYVSV